MFSTFTVKIILLFIFSTTKIIQSNSMHIFSHKRNDLKIVHGSECVLNIIDLNFVKGTTTFIVTSNSFKNYSSINYTTYAPDITINLIMNNLMATIIVKDAPKSIDKKQIERRNSDIHKV